MGDAGRSTTLPPSQTRMSSYDRGIGPNVRTEVLSSFPFEIHDLGELFDVRLFRMFVDWPKVHAEIGERCGSDLAWCGWIGFVECPNFGLCMSQSCGVFPGTVAGTIDVSGCDDTPEKEGWGQAKARQKKEVGLGFWVLG